MKLNKLFQGIDERFENIVLFFPLYQITASTKEEYKDYKLLEINLSTLLFILEKMLTESGNVTNSQLTHFLQQLMKQRYNITLSHEEARDFRKYVVDDKLRNGGSKFLYQYLDDNGDNKSIAFDLIENEKWSHNKEKVPLKLTQKGIEMLFKTKEMYSEIQITVTMLYFKQQLEKGSFSSALNVGKELLFQIGQQRNSIKNDNEQMKRNALSSFNQKKLENKLEHSFEQTKLERSQLQDLQDAIEKVKVNYQGGNLSRKEEAAYDTILKIDRLINKSKAQHELLFAEKEDFLMNVTRSFQMLLDNVFAKQFNIEREIIDQWVLQRISEEKAGKFLRPVMPYHKPQVYNPLTIFSAQSIRTRIEKGQEEVVVLDPNVVEQYKKEQERRGQEKYQKGLNILQIILEPLLINKAYFISDVLKKLKNENLSKYAHLVQENLQLFLNLSIELHRSKYKKFERITMQDLVFATELTKMLAELTKLEIDFLDIGEFEMYATEKVIEFEDGAILTDYVIRRKDEDNGGTI